MSLPSVSHETVISLSWVCHSLSWVLHRTVINLSFVYYKCFIFVSVHVSLQHFRSPNCYNYLCRSCRNGAGYCILGIDCTVDTDFVKDDSGGDCNSLGTAFSPQVSFLINLLWTFILSETLCIIIFILSREKLST